MSEYQHIASLRGPEGPAGVGAHGSLPEGTDFDDLRSPEDTGAYVVRKNNAANGPPLEGLGDPVIHVEVYRNSINGVMQKATTATEVWWRTASNNTEWYDWERLANSAELPHHGSLFSETSIDAMREESDIGHYAVRGDNMLGGPPLEGDNPLAILEVFYGSINGVMQRVTTKSEMWWRFASNGTEWDTWRRVATPDDAGSSIGYDDDGTPFLADGAGSNPQPTSRRLVTEESLGNLSSQNTRSATVKRIITSTDPNEPLQDGDLLLVYESE